eukprot:Hpha_TRINITY_DN27149_c0_g1::TRINITY_DN27149_c0_g1_i1::g.29234::m.29234/K03327/TC.MATE, SLC47A, norM, mdtK, dinF; multidrug resistance protein, MATE family
MGADTLWVEQLKLVLRVGFPIAVSTLLRYATFSVDLAFIGHIGKDELAAATYCTLILNSVQGVVLGIAMSMVALCGQAKGGGNLKLMGSWVAVGSTLAMAAGVLSAVLMAVVTHPLISAIDGDRARLASGFGWVFYWWLPINSFVLTLRYFLQTWLNVFPAMVGAVIAVGLSIALNHLFIHGASGWGGFGFQGSALASLSAAGVQGVILSLYTVWWAPRGEQRECISGLGLHAFTRPRVVTVLRQGFNRCCVIGMQFVAVNIPPLFLSARGSNTVAAGGVLANIASFLFALYWGW